MKKVEVFNGSFDMGLDSYHKDLAKKVIKLWMAGEEAKFILDYTYKPLETTYTKDMYEYRIVLKVYAYLDEQIETFWRLKFK